MDNIVLLDAVLNQLDGILFTGGVDLDPALWNEQQHEETILVHPRRQRFEFMLYEQAKKRRLPILAICLGIQMINVAHGGSLHQHLPDLDDVIDHGDSGIVKHPVHLNPESLLFQWFQTEQMQVNLIAAATAPDGIVEAIELPGYPFLLALQWHPEREMNNPVNHTIIDRFLAATQSK
jgi:putative glutamine amidotransferase